MCHRASHGVHLHGLVGESGLAQQVRHLGQPLKVKRTRVSLAVAGLVAKDPLAVLLRRVASL